MRKTALKLIALASSILTVFAVDPLQIKRGDTEGSNTQNCNIIQGNDLTMLSCPKSYELYVTSKYSMDWHLQEANGNTTHGVLFAKQSDESEHRGAITFVDLNTTAGPDLPVIYRAENVDGEIVTTAIMLIDAQSLPKQSPVQKVWVFDLIVVVQLADGSLVFFEKPMILGNTKTPLLGNILSENSYLPSQYGFKATDLNAITADGASLEYYGVSDTEIMKWSIVFDPDMKRVTISQYPTSGNCTLDGQVIRTATSKDFLIISCSDCEYPGIEFRDRTDLSLVKFYAYSGPFGTAAITIAIFDNDFDTLSVFIGANNQIDQVEYYKNKDGRTFFNFLDNVFNLTLTSQDGVFIQNQTAANQVVVSPQIRVSVSTNYVAFKLSWDDAIYTMANCQYDHQFDDLTFTCKPCAHAGLSFGIQAQECLLCSQMLQKSRSNVLKRQVYMQVCYDGQDKSLAVYILTACVLIIVGCVCCWESEKAFTGLVELPVNWKSQGSRNYDARPNHSHKTQI